MVITFYLKQIGGYWARLTLNPVRYADQPIECIFPELVNTSADTLQQFLDGATLLKGAPYKPEREVRIVAIPGTAERAKYATEEYPDQFDANAPLPDIKTRPNTDKRYVALFDGLGLRLPVKRVIVGPGARQEERAERARSMLGDVPVTMSRCP